MFLNWQFTPSLEEQSEIYAHFKIMFILLWNPVVNKAKYVNVVIISIILISPVWQLIFYAIIAQVYFNSDLTACSGQVFDTFLLKYCTVKNSHVKFNVNSQLKVNSNSWIAVFTVIYLWYTCVSLQSNMYLDQIWASFSTVPIPFFRGLIELNAIFTAKIGCLQVLLPYAIAN